MKLILLATSAAALLGSPAFAQGYGSYTDPQYQQDRQSYEQQREDYERNRQTYERRREDYEQNRQAYDANREAYRDQYQQYRREYRRWARGEYLPRDYWNRWSTIPNWSYYHLRAPRYGYDWVFDGESYLLISRSNGYVADVVTPSDRWYVPYATY